ncbi:hypothetical protein HMI54_006859, partial [Coelomomyces lativittatus]
GGTAGLMEALVCHPLDTIKVRMQLHASRTLTKASNLSPTSTSTSTSPSPSHPPPVVRRTFVGVGYRIAQVEGPLALYKGLGAVVTGIVPKMSIRFSSFHFYQSLLSEGSKGPWTTPTTATFLSGLMAGITEAVLIVTPMEVVKIRLQAQRHSLSDPLDVPKYRSPGHTVYTVVKEEGWKALYKGVSLTALRQATNQAANFTTYQELKRIWQQAQQPPQDHLKPWQHLTLGLIAGAMGPLCNNPIDTIKTRIQRTPAQPGESAYQRIRACVLSMVKHEGYAAFYKGLTPRLLRVAPGNAVTFTVYEFISKRLDKLQWNFTTNVNSQNET